MEDKKIGKSKISELNKITYVTHKMRIGMRSPRSSFAMMIALCSAALFFCIGLLLDTGYSIIFYVGSVLVYFLVYYITLKISKRPDTWRMELDHLLMEYSPVDLGAFAFLQDRIKKNGSLLGCSEEIFLWIGDEHSAIKNRYFPEPVEEEKFINRQLSGNKLEN